MISVVVIYSADDTKYLQGLLQSINFQCEIVLAKTLPVNFEKSELVNEEKNKWSKRKYLTQAISPTDAEARLTKHFEGTMVSFEIVGASETNFVEYVFPEEETSN